MEILTSRKSVKDRIFRLQVILALILDTGEPKTVGIFFFPNIHFQGYQSFQKIDDESDSDRNNLKVFSTTKQLLKIPLSIKIDLIHFTPYH